MYSGLVCSRSRLTLRGLSKVPDEPRPAVGVVRGADASSPVRPGAWASSFCGLSTHGSLCRECRLIQATEAVRPYLPGCLRAAVRPVRSGSPRHHVSSLARTKPRGLKLDQIKRFKELEADNAKLRRAATDHTLDKMITQRTPDIRSRQDADPNQRTPIMLTKLEDRLFSRRIGVQIAAWAFACSSLLSSALAEPVFPKGSDIGMEPPAGMAVATSFKGFEDAPRTSSIVIIELPLGTFEQLSQGFTDDRLKAQGMTVKSRESWPVGERNGLLLTGEQAAGGRVFSKWVLILEGDVGTVLVTAQVPSNETKAYPDISIRKALKSIQIKE
jgi:hypothetical protein